MTKRLFWLAILGLCFASCAQKPVDETECYGKWVPEGIEHTGKCFFLFPNNKFIICNLTYYDLNGDFLDGCPLPTKGTWLLAKETEPHDLAWESKTILNLIFPLVEQREPIQEMRDPLPNPFYFGKVMRGDNGLELWIAVGDLDSFHFLKFKHISFEDTSL